MSETAKSEEKVLKFMGRPPKFRTPEEMQDAAEDYFAKTVGNTIEKMDKDGNTWTEPAPLPVTMAGLARHLGFSRQALLEYKKKSKFLVPIQRAKQLVEDFAEGKLYSPGCAKGASFALKNNHDWEDRSQVDETSNVTVTTTDYQNAEPAVPEHVLDKIQSL